MTLVSNDTSDLPLINPNLLGSPLDQEVAVQAFKYAREIGSQSSMDPIVITEAAPGPEVQTDAEILQYIQKTAYQNWHASCTCTLNMFQRCA